MGHKERLSSSWSLEERITLAVIVELLYVLATRVILPNYFEGVERELYITTLRIASAALYWILFRTLIRGRFQASYVPGRHIIFICVGLTLAAPMLIADYPLPNRTARIIFAITSIAVAAHEEILYRGVLLNSLEIKFGLIKAMLLSNALFVVYHYGAQPLTLSTSIELFSVGFVYTTIYVATGSLLAAIGLHAIYDAIYAVSPLPVAFPRSVGNVLQLMALLFSFAWVAKYRKR